MSQSKKNDDDSDAVPSSPTKKTAEEAFALAAKSILPARRRTQPNIYGSTPSPSPPPLPKPTTSKKKPTTSKKKPTAPLVNSGRTNQSNNKSQKKRGRVSTKKKTPSAPITTTTVTLNVLPGNPSLPMNGTFVGTLSVCLFYVCVEHTDHSI
jgi:hypothetical protein